MKKTALSLTVNGQREVLDVAPRARLLDALRLGLGLTGTKEGCGSGDCGACTVLLDGRPTLSCLILAPEVEGRSIQEAMMQAGGIQCGFCTPGMVMSLKALISDNPDPSEDEIRVAISSNLCRCTGYSKILEAAKSVANGTGNGNATPYYQKSL